MYINIYIIRYNCTVAIVLYHMCIHFAVSLARTAQKINRTKIKKSRFALYLETSARTMKHKKIMMKNIHFLSYIFSDS